MKRKPIVALVAGVVGTLLLAELPSLVAYASTVSTTYYTYKSAYTNQIWGRYSNLSAAENAVRSIPGGVVKNSSWKIVYVQPSYYTYSSVYSNKIVSAYPNLLSAEISLMYTPGAAVKNSAWQFVFVEPTTAYYTYVSPYSHSITGVYTNLSDAISAIGSVPGGVIKDSNWQFLYQQPTFYTYNSVYSNTITGLYPSVQSAEAAIAGKPGAAVKNDKWQFVYTIPVYYTYASAYTNRILGVYSDLQTAINAVHNYPGGAVKNSAWQFVYVNQGYNTVDLRYPSPSSISPQSLDSWIHSASSSTSPLYGLGSSYVNAQNEYGVDATYLLSHSIEESAWGKSSIAASKNNLFGYGAYTNAPADAGVFPSDDYAIRFQAWEVRQNYLTSGTSVYGGSPTLMGMNIHYATDPSWANNISNLMNEVVQGTGGSFGDYQQYSPNNAPVAPSSDVEPIYQLNGAIGTVQAAWNYGGIPVFTDMPTGEYDMLTGNLSNPSTGSQVVTLQRFLNSPSGGSHGLLVDGEFGLLTQEAVTAYQAARGLPQTGICDYSMWQQVVPNQVIIPSNTSVSIDKIEQGMFNGIVTEWYHVTDIANPGISGWVNSDYITFTNVYRIYPSSGYNVAISRGNLHVGDYVVSDGNTVYFYDSNGTPDYGSKGIATLTKISH